MEHWDSFGEAFLIYNLSNHKLSEVKGRKACWYDVANP